MPYPQSSLDALYLRPGPAWGGRFGAAVDKANEVMLRRDDVAAFDGIPTDVMVFAAHVMFGLKDPFSGVKKHGVTFGSVFEKKGGSIAPRLLPAIPDGAVELVNGKIPVAFIDGELVPDVVGGLL